MKRRDLERRLRMAGCCAQAQRNQGTPGPKDPRQPRSELSLRLTRVQPCSISPWSSASCTTGSPPRDRTSTSSGRRTNKSRGKRTGQRRGGHGPIIAKLRRTGHDPLGTLQQEPGWWGTRRVLGGSSRGSITGRVGAGFRDRPGRARGAAPVPPPNRLCAWLVTPPRCPAAR
jgi:hypothetical protein